jgi:hypothetical protein
LLRYVRAVGNCERSASTIRRREVRSTFARDEFIAYLTAPEDRTRPCIRAVACSYVNALPPAHQTDAGLVELLEVFLHK